MCVTPIVDVVDDHGQVVRELSVVADQHEVVDQARHLAGRGVADRELRTAGVHPDRGRPLVPASGPLGVG